MALGKIISFGNQKGGVMKTKLSILLGSYIAYNTDYSVIVFDADPQQSMVRKRSRDELKFGKDTEGFQIVTVQKETIGQMLDIAKEEFDFIFIDLPGTIYQPGILSTYAFLDYLFVPFNPSSDGDFEETIDFIEKVKETALKVRTEEFGLEKTIMYAVPTRVSVNTKHFKEALIGIRDGSFEKFFGIPFITNYVSHNPAVFERDNSTFEVVRKSSGEDFKDICNEIISIIINE